MSFKKDFWMKRHSVAATTTPNKMGNSLLGHFNNFHLEDLSRKQGPLEKAGCQ